RSDALALVPVMDIERADTAAALQFAEADDLAVRFRDIGEVRPQSLVPAGFVHECRRPGLDLLRRVVAAVHVMHGVAEEPHDLQRIAGLEGADSQACYRHGGSNLTRDIASARA